MYGTVRSSGISVIIPWNWMIRLRHRNFWFHEHASGQRFFFLFLGCLCIHALDDFRTYIGLCAISAGVFQFLLLCFAKELPYDQACSARTILLTWVRINIPLTAAYQNLEDAMVDKAASKVVEKLRSVFVMLHVVITCLSKCLIRIFEKKSICLFL